MFCNIHDDYIKIICFIFWSVSFWSIDHTQSVLYWLLAWVTWWILLPWFPHLCISLDKTVLFILYSQGIPPLPPHTHITTRINSTFPSYVTLLLPILILIFMSLLSPEEKRGWHVTMMSSSSNEKGQSLCQGASVVASRQVWYSFVEHNSLEHQPQMRTFCDHNVTGM